MTDDHATGDKWRFDPNGLEVLVPLNYTDHRDCIAQAKGISEAGAWGLGDALLNAERDLGERFSQVIADVAETYKINLVYGTCANAMTGSRRWPKAARTFPLSRSHYVTVSALPDADARALLERAVRDRMNRDELADLKRSVTRACPECKALMVRRGDLFVCTSAECEHTLPYAPVAEVRTVRAEGVAEVAGEYVTVAVHRDLLPGVRDGDPVWLRAKVEIPALVMVERETSAALAA